MTTKLLAYRSSFVTPDTREALRKLESAAVALGGIKILYGGVPPKKATWDAVKGDPGPTELSPPFSMRPTGREVYLSLEGCQDRFVAVATLWSLAVPLGFIPWNRYPLPGQFDDLFHFLGPWASIGDFLHGEGMGEHAWPSMCAAAQCEVGRWEGPKKVERELQMHLHRLGVHCGPVDGMIGERTISSLKALGLGGVELSEACESLGKMSPPPVPPSKRRTGHLILNGVLSEAFCSGGVHTVRTKAGYALTVDGPGRLIVMVQ